MGIGLNIQFLHHTTQFFKTAKGIKDLGMKVPAGILKIIENKGKLTEMQKAVLRVLNKSKDGMSAYDVIAGVTHLINHEHKTSRHKFVDVLNLVNPAKDVLNYVIAEGLVAIKNPGKTLLKSQDKFLFQKKNYETLITPFYFVSPEAREKIELVGHVALLAASLSRMYDLEKDIRKEVGEGKSWSAIWDKIRNNKPIVNKSLLLTKDVCYMFLSGVGIYAILNKKAKIDSIVFTALSLSGTVFSIFAHYSLEYNKASNLVRRER